MKFGFNCYLPSLTHALTEPYNKVGSPQIVQEAVATKMIRMILSIHYSLLYPNSNSKAMSSVLISYDLLTDLIPNDIMVTYAKQMSR